MSFLSDRYSLYGSIEHEKGIIATGMLLEQYPNLYVQRQQFCMQLLRIVLEGKKNYIQRHVLHPEARHSNGVRM